MFFTILQKDISLDYPGCGGKIKHAKWHQEKQLLKVENLKLVLVLKVRLNLILK